MRAEVLSCFPGRGMLLRYYGKPVTQGSMKAVRARGSERIYMKPSNPRLAGFRAAIAEAVAGVTWDPVEGPVAVELWIYLDRPLRHFRGKARELREEVEPYPVGKPDADKVARAALDALTVAGVWLDDAQVIDLRVRKLWVPVDEEAGVSLKVVRATTGGRQR